MKLTQCEECRKFRRHVHKDKFGYVCTSCLTDDWFSYLGKQFIDYEFTYKFLLMELEGLCKD